MQVVHLYVGPKFDQSFLSILAAALPAIVASGLTCDDPGGQLEPEHVDVITHRLSKDDVVRREITIDIEANRFQSRQENLAERQGQILDEVSKFVTEQRPRDWYKPVVRIIVRVKLTDAAFGETAV
ncbi:MAG TPA: hypothetical protein VMQ44_00470 [Candidatus Saccharimonadales bacterium]|nr:hypothetical protein [Candidatus Saccharimonadales bacterium]